MAAEEVPFNETTIGLLPTSLAGAACGVPAAGQRESPCGVSKTPDGNEPPVYTGEVECLGVKINHRRLPYPLRDVRGTISLTPDGLALKDVTACACRSLPAEGSAVIRIDGSATLAQGGLAGGSFTLKTQDMLFTKQLGEAMPEGTRGRRTAICRRRGPSTWTCPS